MSAILDRIYEGMPPTPPADVEAEYFFVAGVCIYRTIVPVGRGIRIHVHEYDHLTIVAAGRGTLMTDDGERQVHAGDVIEVKAGKRHAYTAIEETVWLCVHPTSEEEARRLYAL